MKKKILSLLLCLLLLCSLFSAGAAAARRSYTSDDLEGCFNGIASCKQAACGASSIQEWIDGGLSADAGATAEFYIITLSQSGSYDFSAYVRALLAYLESHEVYSATTREKYALALLACGSDSDYIQRVCDSDIGGQGLMSLVFGLHLLNNGCTSRLYTTGALIDAILSAQLPDGGWAVIGSSGDVDVTAMVIQSLAPYYGEDDAVTAAIDNGLSLLSSLQLSSGGFRSMGAENCESTAQVLTALASLGLDPTADGRFIKGGSTVPDALLGYRNSDGSFAHTGSGYNESATTQAFYALRAYLKMRYGRGPLYIFDQQPANHPQPAPKPSSAAPSHSANTPSGTEPTAAETPSAAETQSLPTSVPASAAPTTGATEPSAPAASAPGAVSRPPAATPQAATPDEADGGGYKLYAVLGVLLAAGIACLILFALKKRSFKHYLAVLLIAAAAIAFLLLTNFESRESYSQVKEKPHPAGAVTMTISCGVLAADEMPDHLPADGMILSETTFTLGECETVYDILLEASKRYDIPIDNRGDASGAYIAGIMYLNEFEHGSLSGWMYRVNGVFPEVGCQGYVLSDGDRIEWLYTKEIGKDLFQPTGPPQ